MVLALKEANQLIKLFINQLSLLLVSMKDSVRSLLASILSNLSSSNGQNDSSQTTFSVQSEISPDSGHREMSSDSVASVCCANTPSDTSWFSALAVTANQGVSSMASTESKFDPRIQCEIRPNSLLLNTVSNLFPVVVSVPSETIMNAESFTSSIHSTAGEVQLKPNFDACNKSFEIPVGNRLLLDFETMCNDSATSKHESTFDFKSGSNVSEAI